MDKILKPWREDSHDTPSVTCHVGVWFLFSTRLNPLKLGDMNMYFITDPSNFDPSFRVMRCSMMYPGVVLIPGTLQREIRFNHFNFNETNFDTLRCDCSLVSCECCGGYDVKLIFSTLSSLDLSPSVKFLSNACSGLSCESINNSNGKKLDTIQSCRETIGAVQCYSYSR